MPLIPRALPPLAGLLLAIAPAAQPAEAVHLTTLDAVPVATPDAVASRGGVRVIGRAAAVAPLTSGEVVVWATAAPVAAVPYAAPVAEALPSAGPPSAHVAGLPAEVALGSVFPNPLAARARVPYELPAAADVRLAVYDALGREVAVLADGERPAGRHEATLDAGRLAPGLYHVWLSTGTFVGATRFTVVR